MNDQQNQTTSVEDSSQESTTNEQHITTSTRQSEHHTSKKKIAMLIASVAVLLIGAVTATFILTNNSVEEVATSEQQAPQQQQPVTTLGASIASVEGTVEYSSDGEMWSEASGGESLANLDYVRTADDSRAIVLFDDGSVARLDNSTELYLSSLEADALEVTLMDGQVYSRVVESENLTFTVVTANERFQALGTAYKTSTDGIKDELEVYQSDVKVESEDIEVSEGNKYDTEEKEQSALEIDALKDDEFAQWNKEKDSESDEFKDKLGVLADTDNEELAPTPAPSSSDGITLSASETKDGVKLSWSMSGVSSKQGFKIVRSTSDATPTYKENDAIYVGNPSARSAVWFSDNGKTHYYRVCIYFEGTCSTYSNAVQKKSPKIEKEAVKSGDINLSIDGNKLSWSLSGGNAPHGFKVVLSKSAGPTYPGNSIQYIGAGTLEATLPEKSADTYFVRVCKYTNGTQTKGCVDYSNEVQYVVE